MKPPTVNPGRRPPSVPAPPRAASPARPAGTYLGCPACGRLLSILWPTRSIVCSCGARVIPPAAGRREVGWPTAIAPSRLDAAVVPALLLLPARHLLAYDPAARPRLAAPARRGLRRARVRARSGSSRARSGDLDRDPIALALGACAAGLAVVYLWAALAGARPRCALALLVVAAACWSRCPTAGLRRDGRGHRTPLRPGRRRRAAAARHRQDPRRARARTAPTTRTACSAARRASRTSGPSTAAIRSSTITPTCPGRTS